MSYCVNCGVELAAGEKSCPLCGIEVNNPLKPYDTRAERPYPKRVEAVRHRMVRITAAKVLSLLLAIPVLTVLAADLIQNGTVTWSLIPAASIALAFMLAVFPCLFKKPRIWMFMLFGTLETAAFLLGLKLWIGGDWYFLFALPITLLSGAAIIGAYLMISSKKASITLKTIIVLVIVMVLTLLLQLIIELNLRHAVRFDWSLYTAISCGLLSIVVLILGSVYRRNERFRKKLFF